MEMKCRLLHIILFDQCNDGASGNMKSMMCDEAISCQLMSTPDRGRTSAVVPIYKSILGVAEVRQPTCNLTS